VPTEGAAVAWPAVPKSLRAESVLVAFRVTRGREVAREPVGKEIEVYHL
jgi:hypothetical protein